VVKEFYQDPTTDEDAWVAVDVAPVKTLKNPVTLQQIKSDKRLANMEIIRLSRLSVSKVQPEEWKVIMEMAGEVVG
jgi:predicted RNA-binding protein with PUA-like domain